MRVIGSAWRAIARAAAARRGAISLVEVLLAGSLTVILLAAIGQTMIGTLQIGRDQIADNKDFIDKRDFANWAQSRLPYASLPLRQAYPNQIEFQLNWQGEVSYVMVWADCIANEIRSAQRAQADGPFAGAYPPSATSIPTPPTSGIRFFARVADDACPGEGGAPDLFSYLNAQGTVISNAATSAANAERLAAARALTLRFTLANGREVTFNQGLGINLAPGVLTEIPNGSMEQGADTPDTWQETITGSATVETDASEKHTGSKSAHLQAGVSSGDKAALTSQVFFSEGDPLQVWVKADNEVSACAIELLNGSNAVLRAISMPTLSTSAWTRVDIPMTNDTSQARRLRLSAGQQQLGTAGCWFDTVVASGEGIAGFAPSDLSALGLWLRADAPAALSGALDGEPVIRWEDASTAGRDGVASGAYIIAGRDAGPLRSANAGSSWSSAAGTSPGDLPAGAARDVRALTRVGPIVLAGTAAGVWRSSTSGDDWTQATGLTTGTVNALSASGDVVVAGTDSGMWRSTDAGETWAQINAGDITATTSVRSVLIAGSAIFAGVDDAPTVGLYRSLDTGASWSELTNGLPEDPVVATLARSGTTFVAGLDDGTAATDDDGIYLSLNQGNAWSSGSSGLSGDRRLVRQVLVMDATMLAATADGVMRSTNGGSAWTRIATGLSDTDVRSLALQSGRLWAGTASGPFVSLNSGQSWTSKTSGASGPVAALAGVCARCPTYAAADEDFAAQPSLRFTSATWLDLANGASLLEGRGDLTMFIVARSADATAQTTPIALLNATADEFPFAFTLRDNGSVQWSFGGGNAQRTATTTTTYDTEVARIYAMSANASGTTSGQRLLRLWVNGAAPSYSGQQEAQQVAASLAAAPAIGADYAGAGAVSGGRFAGEIAEIIVYQRSLDDSERAEVERYLGTRYGIGVSS